MTDNLGNTWTSQFNLVCDSEYLKNVAEMFFLVGVATGGIISGYLSDRFGRRTMLFWSVIFQTIFGKFVVTSLSPRLIHWFIDFWFVVFCISFLFVSFPKRIFAVRSIVVWYTFGVTWTTWFGVGVRYIRWSHIGHWNCRWKMANDCRHVQFISVARFVHDDFRHRISHTRFSSIAIVHRNSRDFPLLFVVSLLTLGKYILSIDFKHPLLTLVILITICSDLWLGLWYLNLLDGFLLLWVWKQLFL